MLQMMGLREAMAWGLASSSLGKGSVMCSQGVRSSVAPGRPGPALGGADAEAAVVCTSGQR